MNTLWLQSPELFSKVDRRVRLPVSCSGLPLCFWGCFFDPYRGNKEFTSCRFFSFFYLGDSYSKKWSFAFPCNRAQLTCQAFNNVIFCDLRSARRFAFRLDLDSPKWDLKVLRTNGKVTFAFFHFFCSGGDFSHVPSNIENSPRGKWALGSKMGLKR